MAALGALCGDVADVDAADARCGGVDGPGGAVGDAGFIPGAAAVEEVGDDGTADAVHDDVRGGDVFDDPAAATAGFEADAAIGAGEDAVGDDDVADAAGGFGAEGDGGVAAVHGAVGDGDVFAGFGMGAEVFFLAGLEGDAVVADVDVAFRDVDVGAGVDVDAIGVGGVGRVDDGEACEGDVVAGDGNDGPGAGVVDFDIFDEDVAAVDEADESGGEVVELLAEVEVPPEGAVAVDFAAAGDGDVFEVFSGDEAGETGGSGGAFPAGGPEGIAGEVGDAEEGGAGVEVEGDVGAHPEGADAVGAGGEEDGSAAGGSGGVDGGLDASGGVGDGIWGDAEVEDVVVPGGAGVGFELSWQGATCHCRYSQVGLQGLAAGFWMHSRSVVHKGAGGVGFIVRMCNSFAC